ncbi:SDR family NAD(P)-dependent oxidoreductase [Tropicibacter sp. R16_0]|uniref:SDR family NAD(P)-dependent oxidoreductase n=1 Tax=Tropicibacter sp. R16_0 TaxID=2821102 RepID=UPI001AD9B4E0|nr:SDR family NAD(P)-dependent oxidoreductase [Tropicibacter sp. R16_0]MBO9453401.1 SDR family NAD(P)-dependent oxidoreductase [Tropicibacter sp. R16_0]
MRPSYKHALIIGAGPGLSASLARLFHANGLRVSLAARKPSDLSGLAKDIQANTYSCNASRHQEVVELFAELDRAQAPDVLVYNPSRAIRKPFIQLDAARVETAMQVNAMGAFYAAQEAAKRMVAQNHGAILFTGASAGMKGYPQSATFAMGKFALRGLAQSLARELHPQGVHIGHMVVDGRIRNADRPGYLDEPGNPDSRLSPDAIAESYWHFLQQDRSAWSWEMELRPWVEDF